MEQEYDDPYEVLDPRFAKCEGDTRVERIYGGCRWAEGPVYVPAGRYLLWSDIPNDRMLRWDETTGVTGVFREPAGHTNGNTLDAAGRLVTCEHGNRRVTRTEHDGSVTVIAERYQGKQLNSPNDVVVAADDAIWFTDATYGIDSDYEGNRGESEIGARHLFRVDAASGAIQSMADDFAQPTGLGFSPDGRRLYVADSRANHLRAFDVTDDGALAGGNVFADAAGQPGVHFDSLDLDDAGRVWLAAGNGVWCFDPDRTLIGRVLIPECTANVTFGGRKRNRLFICASTAVYSIMLGVTGAQRPYSQR